MYVSPANVLINDWLTDLQIYNIYYIIIEFVKI